MKDERWEDGRRREPELYARLLHDRQTEGKTLEDIQREIDRDDEARRVRDATARRASRRGDDLERLRCYVHDGGPHGLGVAFVYHALKRRYPQEYWRMMIERDRRIYAERRRRGTVSDD